MKSSRKPRLRKWLFRLAITGLLAIPLLFLLSNLILRTEWGLGLVEKQLAKRVQGLDWDLEAATWSPWAGVQLSGLRARLQGGPKELRDFLYVKEVRIDPYWKRSFLGKPVLRDLVVTQPELNLPLDFLFLPAPQGTQQVPPPQPQPLPEPKSQPVPEKTEEPAPQSTPQAKPQPQLAQPKIPDGLRKWLTVKDAKFRVYTLSGQSVEAVGLQLKAPYSGGPTKGSLEWKSLRANGQELLSAQSLSFEWKQPGWLVPAQELNVSDLKARVGVYLGIKENGKPFHIQFAVPTQKFPECEFHAQTRAYAYASEFAAAFQSSGLLVRPETWRFDFAANASDIHGGSHLREKDHRFETGFARVFLRNQVISCPGFELRSPDLSLMGNGSLSMNGQMLGVVRIVAAPEIEFQITQIAIGSFLSDGWSQHWMSPLETPDRYYRDLHFEGKLPNQITVDTGRHGEELLLLEAIGRFKAFLKQEAAEERTD